MPTKDQGKKGDSVVCPQRVEVSDASCPELD